MILLKAITIEGKTEYFNLQHIISITPDDKNARLKILMGAGLYWWVERDSIEILNYSPNQLLAELRGLPL